MRFIRNSCVPSLLGVARDTTWQAQPSGGSRTIFILSSDHRAGRISEVEPGPQAQLLLDQLEELILRARPAVIVETEPKGRAGSRHAPMPARLRGEVAGEPI